MSDSQELLVELWKQPSANVHAAQDRLRSTLYVFLLGSFGVSAFLLGDKNVLTSHAPYLAVAADAFLLVVLGYLIQLASNELTLGRAAVEAYEDLIKHHLGNPQLPISTGIFPDLIGKKPRMPLRNELNTAWIAFSMVAAKAVLLLAVALAYDQAERSGT